ncbi:hypothetical protein EX30DRAFT_341174 [Ascodesmis nigricans]|uniref:Uncharacterized protein n=1 Tax=Ascodesmis nigricans TaxID=341454 RepID=A0A4S2MWB5_9PEZI|nr:hypothetical protein EX30DRAFT_341174 [Ascodesmis nigricans]
MQKDHHPQLTATGGNGEDESLKTNIDDQLTLSPTRLTSIETIGGAYWRLTSCPAPPSSPASQASEEASYSHNYENWRVIHTEFTLYGGHEEHDSGGKNMEGERSGMGRERNVVRDIDGRGLESTSMPHQQRDLMNSKWVKKNYEQGNSRRG